MLTVLHFSSLYHSPLGQCQGPLQGRMRQRCHSNPGPEIMGRLMFPGIWSWGKQPSEVNLHVSYSCALGNGAQFVWRSTLSLYAQWNIPEDKVVVQNEHYLLTEMGLEKAKQNAFFSFFRSNLKTFLFLRSNLKTCLFSHFSQNHCWYSASCLSFLLWSQLALMAHLKLSCKGQFLLCCGSDGLSDLFGGWGGERAVATWTQACFTNYCHVVINIILEQGFQGVVLKKKVF